MKLSNGFVRLICITAIFIHLNQTYAQTNQWRLTWDMNSEPDITAYRIYRYTSDESVPFNDSLRAVVSANTSTDSSEINLNDSTITFFDDRLQPGLLFTYRVKAVNSSFLESDYSEPESAAIPLINRIPNQAVNEGSSFNTIHLDNYITDPDHGAAQMTWTASGNSQLTVELDSIAHTVNVIPPGEEWTGSERITFIATDPDGFWNSYRVRFTVNEVNYQPEINVTQGKDGLPLIDTTAVINEDTPFVCHDSTWFPFVTDGDNDDAELTYRIKGSACISVKDSLASHILIPMPDFCGTDTLELVVSDGNSADSARFVVEVSPVNDLPSMCILQEPSDQTIMNVTDTVHFAWSPSTDPDGDDLSYTLKVWNDESGAGMTIPSIQTHHFTFSARGIMIPGATYAWNVSVTDGTESIPSDTSHIVFRNPDAIIGNDELIPIAYDVYQNYPNPFNPATTIKFSMPQAGQVTLEVFNVLGQRVALVLDDYMPSGYHSVIFDAGHLPSGTYFYHFRSASYREIRKMVLRK